MKAELDLALIIKRNNEMVWNIFYKIMKRFAMNLI